MQLAALLPKNVEALAGLELGGIPIVTALCQVTGLPARQVLISAEELKQLGAGHWNLMCRRSRSRWQGKIWKVADG